MIPETKLHGARAIAVVVVASTSLVSAAAVSAHTRSFSFGSVEFMPRDQREAAASAFVADELPPGTPISTALHVLRKADAYCHAPRLPDGSITCSHYSFKQHPDDAGIVDVIWTVKVNPTADGTVASASVHRSKSGF